MLCILTVAYLRFKNKVDEDMVVGSWLAGLLELCLEVPMILTLAGKL